MRKTDLSFGTNIHPSSLCAGHFIGQSHGAMPLIVSWSSPTTHTKKNTNTATRVIVTGENPRVSLPCTHDYVVSMVQAIDVPTGGLQML
jgi:hypothetical protein